MGLTTQLTIHTAFRGTGAVLFFKADWTFLSMMPTDY